MPASRKTGYMCKAKSGFTLVELLVVISIIALLLSMLMPTLAKAREQARKTVCFSNLHSVGLAMHSYASIYSGKLPPAFGLTDTQVVPMFIKEEVYAKMKTMAFEPKSLICPSWTGDYIWQNSGTVSPQGKYKAKDLLGGSDPIHDSPVDLRFVSWGGIYWPDGRLLGYNFLQNIKNLTEAAQNISDSSRKLLAVDMNMCWYSTPSDSIWSSHTGRNYARIPAGSSRLRLDGSVYWASYRTMAANDTELKADTSGRWISPHRWTHWNDSRRYYW